MRTPIRFSGRANMKGVPRRVGRVLEGAVDTDRKYGETLDVARDGRLEVRIAKGSILRQTRQGLTIDEQALGEKNRAMMSAIDDVPAGSGTSTLVDKVNEILAELRRTKRLRGGFNQ